MRNLAIVVAMLIGCSGSTPSPTPDAPKASIDAPAGGGAAFGASCTVVSDTSTECASHVCTDAFNMLGDVCSVKCDGSMPADPVCPNGSQGVKCNLKGYCRP